jgi:hypothetical protein
VYSRPLVRKASALPTGNDSTCKPARYLYLQYLVVAFQGGQRFQRMDKIIQEKISADHLLYVSLKYTKTGDVILNLIKRWTSMIDEAISSLLIKAKKDKKISTIPIAPKMKVIEMRKVFKKDDDIMKTIDLYEFFKRVPTVESLKENEFRKNITLRVNDGGTWVEINLEKLKEYSIILERFISRIKQLL